MPGIYGYVKNKNEQSQLVKMTDTLFHHNHFLKNEDYIDDCFEASHIYLSKSKVENNYTSFFREGVYLSIDGEQYSHKNKKFLELMFEAYKENRLTRFLNSLDGYFNAVIYDYNSSKIFLVSDRYGMRMLYYYFNKGRFAFSGEVKGLLALNFVDAEIDKRQIDCFMDLGYLLEDNTWHKNIKLIKPASILEFDLTSKELKNNYYWKWSEIKQKKVSFDDAVDILGDLWLKAVEKRFNIEEKTLIPLSGGLDSRAIFAAVQNLWPESKGDTITFGKKNCDDKNIAKKCVDKTSWAHQELSFTSDNWFKPRFDRVWYTDGMFNLMHMHGSEFNSKYNGYNNVLSGALGDVILGFTRLQNKHNTYDKRINIENSNVFYKGYSSESFVNDDFYNIATPEPFLIMNDGRRFTNMGIVNSLTNTFPRLPFLDNELIEFVYSIPDSYREGYRLYHAMLIKFFPEYFKKIPWQNTGRVIGKQLSQKFIPVSKRRLEWRLKRLLKKYGLLKDNKSYTDYPNWIKEEEVYRKIKELLSNDKAEYRKYTEEDFYKKYLIPHYNKEANYTEEILRAVTIELYLKKILTSFSF